MAHELACANGIELGGCLDALGTLLEVNDDLSKPAPICMHQFLILLDIVRSKMQDAKDTMEGLISDLEKEVSHE